MFWGGSGPRKALNILNWAANQISRTDSALADRGGCINKHYVGHRVLANDLTLHAEIQRHLDAVDHAGNGKPLMCREHRAAFVKVRRAVSRVCSSSLRLSKRLAACFCYLAVNLGLCPHANSVSCAPRCRRANVSATPETIWSRPSPEAGTERLLEHQVARPLKPSVAAARGGEAKRDHPLPSHDELKARRLAVRPNETGAPDRIGAAPSRTLKSKVRGRKAIPSLTTRAPPAERSRSVTSSVDAPLLNTQGAWRRRLVRLSSQRSLSGITVRPPSAASPRSCRAARRLAESIPSIHGARASRPHRRRRRAPASEPRSDHAP